MPSSSARDFGQPVVLGFDPGRDKCGLALMGIDRVLLYHQVVQSEEALAEIQTLRQAYPVSMVVMGDQTTAKLWRQRIGELPNPPRVMSVDERYSTLEARDRYWQMYPPRGFTRLLPRGLRNPPRPIDDIVAVLLIERYLNRLTASCDG